MIAFQFSNSWTRWKFNLSFVIKFINCTFNDSSTTIKYYIRINITHPTICKSFSNEIEIIQKLHLRTDNKINRESSYNSIVRAKKIENFQNFFHLYIRVNIIHVFESLWRHSFFASSHAFSDIQNSSTRYKRSHRIPIYTNMVQGSVFWVHWCTSSRGTVSARLCTHTFASPAGYTDCN